MLRFWPFLVAAAVALADRASKHWIETKVEDWQVFQVIPGLFQIVHTRNTGIAFSLFANREGEESSLLLVVFSVVVMTFVAAMLWGMCRPLGKEDWTMKLALGLVLGGAIGNLYDRVFRGAVTDFLDFYTGAHHFPVFNVADSAITVGAMLLLLSLWPRQKRG